MLEGFKICMDWNMGEDLPDLPNAQIFDKVAETVTEMAVENGKMARTLHEVLLRVMNNDTLSAEDVSYLRNVIIGNLGRAYADPFSKEKHKD